MSDLVGVQLGAYKVVEVIGKGGMSTVYKAYHPSTDRFVAIKVMSPDLMTSPEFAARFDHEARLVASLQHVHILQVFDYHVEDKLSYLVMPYIEAGTLRERTAVQRFTLLQIIRILNQLADALDYAHRKRILHRDLKPENILIDENDDVRLTDFGIARLVENSRIGTSTGTIIGTPTYMSPEQGQGQPLDHRSDLYSLGVLLYELVVGEIPYDAPTPLAIVFKHVYDPIPAPRARNPHLSEALENVLIQALEKEPAKRFQSASEMAQAFEAAARLNEAATLQDAPTQVMPAPELPKLELPQPTNDLSELHIFISYSSTDRKPFVEKLADDLVAQKYTLWIDNVGTTNLGLLAGEQWRQSIANAINQAAVVLMIMTPESVQSEWVCAEIARAQALGKPIIPVLLKPVTSPLERRNLAALNLDMDQIHYRDFVTTGYDQAFQQLLRDLSIFISRVDVGIVQHCRKYPEKFIKESMYYIEGEARLLPINASPYDQSVTKAKQEHLISRLRRSTRMIVLGEPGQGKTMALEQIALFFTRHTHKPQTIPIYIKLLRYNGKALLEWVRLELNSTGEIKQRSIEETRQFLDETRYECYFLLDGLNEVRPEYRDQLIEEITQLALEYPRHRMAVTSRVQDKSWRILHQNSPLQEIMLVQPIRENQAQKYLIDYLGTDDGTTLWRQLDAKMRGLATTPLLLWLIKEAWLQAKRNQRGGMVRIPDNRGELYEGFVSRMLARDDERRLSERMAEADRLRVLEAIAVYMHQEKSLTIKRKQALAIIEKGTPLNKELVLQNLLQNGLLTGDRDLRFAPHQTIQEYFAARALKDEILRIARKRTGILGVFVGPGLLEAANDPWWAETFIQIAGLADDPNALAVTLADFNPWLAWWCVQEGRAVNKRTSQIIQAKSMEMIQSPKFEERRRGAETLAKLQTPRALEPLITLLGDPVPEIHHLATNAVSTFGEAAVPFLVDALNDESLPPVARSRALGLLSQVAYKDELKNQRVLKPLAQLAMNSQPEVAITALQVLMSLEDEGEALLDRILVNRQPPRRAKWGEVIAENDCRPGVTIRPDGLPDIAWYKVDGATVGGIELEYRRVEPFYIAKYPVTYAQYQAFIEDEGYTRDIWWQKFPHIPRTLRQQPLKIANYPRVNISWYEAIAFCRWLTARYRVNNEITEKWVIRLPTEWEWEQAAMGYIDDEHHDRIPGFDVTHGNTPAAKIGGVCAVGLFPEGCSAFGAMDMGGNVREWCLNMYNWHTGTRRLDDERRSLRGGSWEEATYQVAPTTRDFAAASERGKDIGFRLCIAPLNLKPVGVSSEDPGV